MSTRGQVSRAAAGRRGIETLAVADWAQPPRAPPQLHGRTLDQSLHKQRPLLQSGIPELANREPVYVDPLLNM